MCIRDRFKIYVGEESDVDLMEENENLEFKRIVVTNSKATGKLLSQLNLRTRFNINVTRINRAGVEFVAHSNSVLQFGDVLTVVGPEKDLVEVSKTLGNSVKHLNEPNIIPIFIGIALGVLLGSIPIYIEGIPVALKLGLAGGPLIIAIIASRIGQIGKVSMYMSPGANLIMRELGIVLFLASVGFSAGGSFWKTLVEGNGMWWMLYGAMITFIPLVVVSIIARAAFKKNYMDILGLLSGSMTDPPALAFANSYAHNDYPAVTYATVYPLTMFLRIMVAQFLILFLL
jgi:putative transport protein